MLKNENKSDPYNNGKRSLRLERQPSRVSLEWSDGVWLNLIGKNKLTECAQRRSHSGSHTHCTETLGLRAHICSGANCKNCLENWTPKNPYQKWWFCGTKSKKRRSKSEKKLKTKIEKWKYGNAERNTKKRVKMNSIGVWDIGLSKEKANAKSDRAPLVVIGWSNWPIRRWGPDTGLLANRNLSRLNHGVRGSPLWGWKGLRPFYEF